jgi:hypothetical protein
MIVRVAENGKRGYFPVSGMKLRLLDFSVAAPFFDFNQDGKQDDWEKDRLRGIVEFASGLEIDDKAQYTLALPDFCAEGGDDLLWVMSQIPKERIQLIAGPMVREALEAYLAKNSPVNTKERPLVQPGNPRVVFEK